MSKLRDKVLKMNFPRFFKRFIIAAVLLVLGGGAVCGAAFRTQISDAIANEREDDRYDKERDNKDAADYKNEHDKEDAKDHDSDHSGTGSYDHEKEHDDFEDILLTQTTTGQKILLGAFGVICLALLGIYWLAVSAWVYQAAVHTGYHGFLWFLLALAGNLAAAVAFLIVRGIFSEKCANCSSWQKRNRKYCHSCGAPMQDICPDCGTANRRGTEFCPVCGRNLRDVQEEKAEETAKEEVKEEGEEEQKSEPTGEQSEEQK